MSSENDNTELDAVERRQNYGRRKSDNVVRLVRNAGDAEQTLLLLDDLAREARAGHVLGMAYITIRPRLDYDMGFAGACRHYPEMALGISYRLQARLRRYIEEGE